ncbi:hypothetical protein C8R45DRAFT_1102798 [Mycena sanguinolenta]|nr:hypothetical protein C8R45DRAFT_1102798 [Mycena sanguinolenta]
MDEGSRLRNSLSRAPRDFEPSWPRCGWRSFIHRNSGKNDAAATRHSPFDIHAVPSMRLVDAFQCPYLEMKPTPIHSCLGSDAFADWESLHLGFGAGRRTRVAVAGGPSSSDSRVETKWIFNSSAIVLPTRPAPHASLVSIIRPHAEERPRQQPALPPSRHQYQQQSALHSHSHPRSPFQLHLLYSTHSYLSFRPGKERAHRCTDTPRRIPHPPTPSCTRTRTRAPSHCSFQLHSPSHPSIPTWKKRFYPKRSTVALLVDLITCGRDRGRGRRRTGGRGGGGGETEGKTALQKH